MLRLYPFVFDLNLHELVWGGNRLCELKGLSCKNEEHIGESWEVSAVSGSESVIVNGPLKGRKLTEVVSEYKERLLGKSVFNHYGGEFPLLVKFIDAASDLSIQVHPNDELAKMRHNSFGKNEMWYVMDSKEEGKLLCGFNEDLTKEEYRRRIAENTICDVLQQYAVERGDVFYIPAGRVHAICGGTLVAEVQQSSNITYRLYDYGRLGLDGKPRELHTELAEEAIDYKVSESVQSMYDRKLNWPVAVVESPFFTVKLLEINRGFHRKLFKYDSFIIYMCLSGNCKIEVQSCIDEGGEMPEVVELNLTAGNSCLVPAEVADLMLEPDNEYGMTRLLEVYIDNKHFKKD